MPPACVPGRLPVPEAAGAADASNLDELAARSGAALWVHGHIHQAADYYLAVPG